MIRNLSPIHDAPHDGGADDGAASHVDPEAFAVHSGSDDGAAKSKPGYTTGQRIAMLEAVLSERDAYIETLSAENTSLAATAKRLLQDKIDTAQLRNASAAASSRGATGRPRPTEPLASPSR